MSICSIEDVALAVDKPFWFQLYVMKDRGFVRALIERAAAAKCSALVLTVDLQVLGQRHRDIKNGMTVPPELRIRNLIDIASKPAWALSIARGKRRTFGNLAGHIRGMENVNSLSHWIAGQFDETLSWKDVEWIAGLWPGKLILKGILDVEDARIAAKTGAAALVVSNHGGRQLDGAPSSISALPPIVDAVGSSIEVLFDGGIRSGQDIMRAIALGARACLSGRAYIYGLGAGGQAGVARAIEIMRNELERQHGADRRQQHRRNRSQRDRADVDANRSSPPNADIPRVPAFPGGNDAERIRPILPCSHRPARCRSRRNICTAGICPTW